MYKNKTYGKYVASQRDRGIADKLASVRALICVTEFKSLRRPGNDSSHHDCCFNLAVECSGVWGRPEQVVENTMPCKRMSFNFSGIQIRDYQNITIDSSQYAGFRNSARIDFARPYGCRKQ